MPRVRGTAGAGAGGQSGASPVKTVQIPLNDDKEEKAARLQSRQALHSKQMNQLKAAANATPQKRGRRSLGGDGNLHTPTQDDEDDGANVYGVRGDHVTPMKRVPILANFEEWMKMATDNKINATNSWNFALIDYFHDMTLLREGDGVNFQKASCTLDGCVKIYTSRVDSVATETGKLLSGLADSGNKKRKGGDAENEGEEGDEDEENEDGTKKKGRKKAARSAEATLANSFDQLRLKKMELEFSVDPLFKKASADFDEGGAKGLLLNHLSIDSTGRIVFDSSDDAQAEENDDTRRDSMDPDGGEDETEKQVEPQEEQASQDLPIDIHALGMRFFPDLEKLDEQDICPTMKTFELGGGTDSSLDLPFLKAPENWRDEHHESQNDDQNNDALDDDNVPFEMDDDDGGMGGFDLAPEVAFGEGGEAWARDAALQPQMRVFDAGAGAEAGEDDAAGEVGVFDNAANAYGVTLQHRPDHDQENILNYFDNAMQKNWAGPEHWKIARIKEATKDKDKPKTVRKEKEPFEIDFSAPMSQDLANVLYTSASNNSTISLPKKEWKSRTRNLLPDDKHFNSKDLLKLFLKPKAKLGARKSSRQNEAEVDEAYWAAQARADVKAIHPMDDDDAPLQGDYDANFFQDDGLPMVGGAMDDDDDDFADAQENFLPDGGVEGVEAPVGEGIDSIPMSSSDAFGANLVAQSRRMRPEYVQYARVAKKVDVRRLKEEMWRGIGYEALVQPETPNNSTNQRPQIPSLSEALGGEKAELMFTDIMNNLQHVYPRQQMSDISTSYGFICLLHLANEKGLVVENCEEMGWRDLRVRRDFDAVVGGGE